MVQNLTKIFEEMFHIFIYFFRCINDFMVLVLLCYASQHIWKDNSGVWCLFLVLLLVNLKPHLWFLTGPFHWDSYWNLWNSLVFPSSSVLLVMKLSRHTKKTLHACLWQQLISTSVYFLLLVENKISFSACSCSCVNLTALSTAGIPQLFFCVTSSHRKRGLDH